MGYGTPEVELGLGMTEVRAESSEIVGVCCTCVHQSLCNGVKLVILRRLDLHAFPEVLYGVHDTPMLKHGVMRVFRHVDMVTHHKSHLLHSFLGEFSCPLAGEATCRESIGASCVDTCLPDIDSIGSG